MSDHVAQYLALNMTQLQELHLAPGKPSARFELDYFAWAIAGLTGLKALSIAGAKEQDDFQCWRQLDACLWTLTTLTHLTSLKGFEICYSKLPKFWAAVKGG